MGNLDGMVFTFLAGTVITSICVGIVFGVSISSLRSNGVSIGVSES